MPLTRSKLIGCAAVAAALAVGVTPAIVMSQDTGSGTAPTPAFPLGTTAPAALGQVDAGATGALPAGVAAALPQPFEVDPSAAVLVRRHRGHDLYLTRSTEGAGEFCALVARDSQVLAISCGPRRNIGTGLLTVSVQLAPGGDQPGLTFGVVPPGYVSVTSGEGSNAVSDSSFVLERGNVSEPVGALTYTGAAGERVTADPQALAGR